MMSNLRAIRNGYSFTVASPGEYTRLIGNGTVWMSDTNMEISTNRLFAENAKGDVLVFGLGLGVLFDLVDWNKINLMNIVELNQEVIDLIEPYLNNSKISIIKGDALSYETTAKYDTVYFDIWPNVCLDNWEEMVILKEKGKEWLKEDGWVGCWLDTELYRKLFCSECEETVDDCCCDKCWQCDIVLYEDNTDDWDIYHDCYVEECDECGEDVMECDCE